MALRFHDNSDDESFNVYSKKEFKYPEKVPFSDQTGNGDGDGDIVELCSPKQNASNKFEEMEDNQSYHRENISKKNEWSDDECVATNRKHLEKREERDINELDEDTDSDYELPPQFMKKKLRNSQENVVNDRGSIKQKWNQEKENKDDHDQENVDEYSSENDESKILPKEKPLKKKPTIILEDSNKQEEQNLPTNEGKNENNFPLEKTKRKKSGFKKVISRAKILSPFRNHSKTEKIKKDEKQEKQKQKFHQKEQKHPKKEQKIENKGRKHQEDQDEMNSNSFIDTSHPNEKKEINSYSENLASPLNEKIETKARKKSLFGRLNPSNTKQQSPVKEIERPTLQKNPSNHLNASLETKEIFGKPDTRGGARAGIIGSGVLLEGWLKQKQRKGVKGMKHWHERYFVLYAKYNEVRYYTDVIYSAWGPIPLGEIGAIPLRLIQKIGTPSHPKYKGCRFDITCRSSWGTHYADDFISSDEEHEEISGENISKTATRMYSLLADTPQTRVTWVTMLDSLLKRSEQSPRTHDVMPLCNLTPKASTTSKTSLISTPKSTPKKVLHRRPSHVSDMEIIPIYDDGKNPIPYAVRIAIDFLEASSPGIELQKFYEMEANGVRVKSSLLYLNDLGMNSSLNKPNQNELEQYLDSITAGAIVKQWIYQMEQPLIPFELYDDFIGVAEYAEDDPYDLVRTVQSLVDSLPTIQAQKLEYLIFHLAGVAEYSKENKLTPKILGNVFGNAVLRPHITTKITEQEKRNASIVIQYMIANAEAIF